MAAAFAGAGVWQFADSEFSAWSGLTGTAFFAAGAVIFLNAKMRLASTLAGVLVLMFALGMWIAVASHPQNATDGWYLKELGLAGGALLLAGALPRRRDG